VKASGGRESAGGLLPSITSGGNSRILELCCLVQTGCFLFVCPMVPDRRTKCENTQCNDAYEAISQRGAGHVDSQFCV
jgi:hypothetical protein